MFPCQGHRDTFSHSDRFSEPWWRPSGGSGSPTLPAPLGRCWDCCCSSSSSSCPSCRFSLCACCPSCRFPWPSAPCPSKSSSWPSLCWKSPHPCFQKLWLATPTNLAELAPDACVGPGFGLGVPRPSPPPPSSCQWGPAATFVPFLVGASL